MPDEQTLLLYDRDCGFCRYSAGILLRWDRRAHNRLAPLAIQDPRAVEALKGMNEETRMASWHLAMPDGSVVSAGAALPVVLELTNRHRVAAAAFRRFPAITERGYKWVTNHRNTLGKFTRRWAAIRGTAYPPVITEGDSEITRCSIA